MFELIKHKIREQIQQLRLTNIWTLMFILGFILIVIIHSSNKEESVIKTELAATEPSLDEQIPEGYVLLPIQVENYESLKALIDQYAIVDLYTIHKMRKQKGQKIASHVKLIRAPQDPEQFAVLIPNSLSPELMSQNGPFLVVIQSRKKYKATEINVSQTPKLRSRIEFNN